MPKLVFKLSDSQSLDFPLAGDHVRLGRSPANDIVIDNSWISSFHAEFRLTPEGAAELRDLKSSNGTTVNGKTIEVARLKPGDVVAFGQLEAIFDPPAPNAPGLNGGPAREAASASALPPVGMTPPLPRTVLIPKAQPVTALPRPAATEPVPAVNKSNRLSAPAAVPATAPVPADQHPPIRLDLQQAQADLSTVRDEIKSLKENLDALKKERTEEEQNSARRREQGEKEERALQSRLDSLKKEIESAESAAATSRESRIGKLSADELELTARVAELRATLDSSAATVREQEEKIAGLTKNVEALQRQSESSAVDLAEKEMAVTAANATAAETKARLATLESTLQSTEAQFASRDAELKASIGKLAELENAKARLAETEASLAESSAKAQELAAAIQTDLQKQSEMATELSAAEAEQKKLSAAITALTAELDALNSRKIAAESEFASRTTDAEQVAARLREAEASVGAATERLGKVQSEISNAEGTLRERESLLEGGTSEIAAVNAKLEEARRELSNRQSAIAELEQSKVALSSGAAALTREIGSLKEQRERLAAGHTSLGELTTRLEEMTVALAQRQASLAKLDMDAVAAEAAARSAREAQTEALKVAAELDSNRKSLAAITGEIADMQKKRASATDTLGESNTQLEALRQKIAAARAESDALEELRAETAALQRRADELDRTVRRLEEKKQTFADAPDPNWGTVHAMAKGLIKQVDLLDDLITHLVGHHGSKESIEQMKIFRAGLMDILTEFSVVPYRYEEGFAVDVSARKRIQIVETQEDNGQGTRIEKTYRPGYICSNGPVGVQTLLRKAEVSILMGR